MPKRRGRRRLRIGTKLFGTGGLLRGRRQRKGQRFGNSTLESHALDVVRALRRRRS